MSIISTYPNEKVFISAKVNETIPKSTAGDACFMCVYMSDKGEDNKIKEYEDAAQFYKDNGPGVFKEHGQPILNAERILAAGGKIFGMRIMPNDAAFANVILCMEICRIENPGLSEGESSYKYEVSLSTKSIPDITDKSLLETAADALYVGDFEHDTANTEDENIKKVVLPLMTIVPKGRGSFGNNLSVKFGINNQRAWDDRGYPVFSLDVYNIKNGARSIDDTVITSLYEKAKYNGLREYVEEITDELCNNYSVICHEKHVDKSLEILKEITGIENLNTENFSLLDLKYSGEIELENVTFSESDFISNLVGVRMQNGCDGVFDMDNPDRETAIAQAYSEAFSGVTDKRILNPRETSYRIIMDANYPANVKKSIATLINTRDDVFGIFDAGVMGTTEALKSWKSTSFTYNNWRMCGYGESGKVANPLGGKAIIVTETYLLANDLTRHLVDKGIGIPFASINITGPASRYIKGTRTPLLDMKALDELAELRINVSEVNKGRRSRETQFTFETKATALVEMNNALIALKMQDVMRDEAKKARYTPANNNTVERLKKAGTNRILSEFKETNLVQDFKLEIQQTEQERRAGILKWVLNVKFNYYNKYSVIYINID